MPIENVLMTLKYLKRCLKVQALIKFQQRCCGIALSLTFIFNLWLSTGEFVDDWKHARFFPIHKDGSKLAIGNCRPISVLPIISKIFEQEIFQQLYKYMNEIILYLNLNPVFGRVILLFFT